MAKIISLARYKKKKLRKEHGDDMGAKLEILAETEAENKRLATVAAVAKTR